MIRVAAIGEAMIELAIDGPAAQVGVAGDTLNTAIYLKRAAPEISVDYVTCLGDDPFSDRIAEFIASQGIGTGHCQRLAGQSPGLYAISTSDDGERSFTYWRSASAARSLFKAGNGHNFDVLEGYDLLYLSGISVAILPHDARKAFLDWLRASPIRLAYDSNYRPRLWEDKSVAQQVSQAFWERADVCLPSIDDEMALFDETEAQVTERFISLDRTGALKRGADGPVSLGNPVTTTYQRVSKVVDTTAAGDSFNGGYLGAHLQGKDQAFALNAGHAMAARVVQYRGAIVPEEEPA